MNVVFQLLCVASKRTSKRSINCGLTFQGTTPALVVMSWQCYKTTVPQKGLGPVQDISTFQAEGLEINLNKCQQGIDPGDWMLHCLFFRVMTPNKM